MKWGVSRYTNVDCTLTKEGQTRYNQIVAEKKNDKLYDEMVRKKNDDYYEYSQAVEEQNYDRNDTEINKKLDDLFYEYNDAFWDYADEVEKVMAKHENIQKKIDAGEAYYKDLDPEILNQIINEDDEQVKETNKKIQAEIDRKQINTATAIAAAITSVILGTGAYLNYKKKKK